MIGSWRCLTSVLPSARRHAGWWHEQMFLLHAPPPPPLLPHFPEGAFFSGHMTKLQEWTFRLCKKKHCAIKEG